MRSREKQRAACRDWKRRNRKQVSDYNRRYQQTHRAEKRIRDKRYYEAHKPEYLAKCRQRYVRVRDTPEYKAAARAYQKAWAARRPYRAERDNPRTRSEHHRNSIDHGYRLRAVLSGRAKGSPMLEREIGCSVHELRLYIASQFTPEMSWENYGTYWSVDHLEPKCHFNLSKEEDRKVCFHYTNLRPLPKQLNTVPRTLIAA